MHGILDVRKMIEKKLCKVDSVEVSSFVIVGNPGKVTLYSVYYCTVYKSDDEDG